MFRTLSALLVPASALVVIGLARVAPRFHPAFLPGLYVVAQTAVVAAIGHTTRQFSAPFPDCDVLERAGVPAGAPVYSYDPIGTSTRCGHPGVVLGRDVADDDVRAVADRYGLRFALLAPGDYRSWTRSAAQDPPAGWDHAPGDDSGRVLRRTGP